MRIYGRSSYEMGRAYRKHGTVYRGLVGNACTCTDIFRMDIGEMDWVNLAQEGEQCRGEERIGSSGSVKC
jgi:hypothetical protein